LLIFAAGVVTGAPAGGTGRHAVGGKSVLSGGFASSEVGGFWGAELKHAGWDAIVIRGRSEKPVYLWIHDDKAELRDASQLWGKATADVETALKEELGDKRIRVAQCGPAGEKLVRFACVMHDVNRAAGRTGQGAVMGSKNLKAVVVRGSGKLPLAEPAKVQEVARWLRDNYMTHMGAIHEHGTNAGLLGLSATGGLPTRNFQQGTFEGAEKISGEAMTNTILVERDSCWACPVQCKRVVETHGRYETLPVYGGPEYETIGSFGSMLGVDDLEGIAYVNQQCNAYGLDTISAGVTIAWAMECFERGLLTTEDTGGLELKFGNIQAAIELVEQMAQRTGFGAILAEGSLRAARKVGRGTEKYAMQIKGQEIPMHEPRLKVALDIGYATSPTGADHCHNVHDTFYSTEGNNALDMRSVGILHPPVASVLDAEKVRLAVVATNKRLFCNSLGLCHFMAYHYQHLADLVNGVTGWNCSVHELMLVAERSMAMARAVNYREGMTAKDDVNHWRFMTPFTSGPVAATIIPAEEKKKAMDLYYDYRGWDKESGAPTKSRLHELGLHWLAEELYK